MSSICASSSSGGWDNNCRCFFLRPAWRVNNAHRDLITKAATRTIPVHSGLAGRWAGHVS